MKTTWETQAMLKQKSGVYLLPWVICALAAVFYCYEYFLRIAPSVMATDLMKAYNIDATHFGNLAAFYYYVYTPMQLVVGISMDRYGPRRLLFIACLCCAVGTYLFASATTLGVAEFGRFLVGFGSAFAFVGVLKLATIWLPPERFAMFSGMAIALGMIGAMAGDMTLTEIVKIAGWRHTLLVAAYVGIALAFIILMIVRDKPDAEHDHHYTHVLEFNYLFSELFQLIKRPQIWVIGIIGCMLYLSASVFAELWGIPYLKATGQFTPEAAASAVSLVFLGFAIGGPLAGWISDKLQRRKLPIIAGSFLSAALMLYLLYGHVSVTTEHVLLFFLGILTSAQILVFATACENAPTKISGTAIALTNMLVMIGGNFFQPITGMLLDMRWQGLMVDGVRVYSASNYQLALTFLPVSFFLSGLLAFFLRETHCRPYGS